MIVNKLNWNEWSAIWSEIHKGDFKIERACRPKLHDMKLNCLSFIFWCIFLLSILKRISCDKNSFEHEKRKSSSEVRTKTVYFMHQGSLINDGRRSFRLWLRLGLLVNCLWRRNLGRSAPGVILWWIFSCETPSRLRCPMDGSVALCMILRDSGSLISLFVFVSSA